MPRRRPGLAPTHAVLGAEEQPAAAERITARVGIGPPRVDGPQPVCASGSAVAASELVARLPIVGCEVEAVADSGQPRRPPALVPRRDIAHQARAFRCAVGCPEFDAMAARGGIAVGGHKEEQAVGHGEPIQARAIGRTAGAGEHVRAGATGFAVADVELAQAAAIGGISTK